MPRDVPPLSEAERSLITKTLVEWASTHPRPAAPIIQLADASELSPVDIANAVAEPKSRRGQFIFRVFAAGLIEDPVEPPESLETILSDFRADIDRWRSGSIAR
jgi:hypothetical protein